MGSGSRARYGRTTTGQPPFQRGAVSYPRMIRLVQDGREIGRPNQSARGQFVVHQVAGGAAAAALPR